MAMRLLSRISGNRQSIISHNIGHNMAMRLLSRTCVHGLTAPAMLWGMYARHYEYQVCSRRSAIRASKAHQTCFILACNWAVPGKPTYHSHIWAVPGKPKSIQARGPQANTLSNASLLVIQAQGINCHVCVWFEWTIQHDQFSEALARSWHNALAKKLSTNSSTGIATHNRHTLKPLANPWG